MSDNHSDFQHNLVRRLLPEDWNASPYTLATEIREFLKSLKDEGTNIDSGMGFDGADLWVKIEREEYHINVKKSPPKNKDRGGDMEPML